MTLKDLKAELKHQADAQRAKDLQRFFKTDKGDYGEGDVFWGITVPQSRLIVKQFWRDLNPTELQQLLDSKIHEERFISLLCLIEKYNVSDLTKRKAIYSFYMYNVEKGRVNNWDLVDLSAPNIVGNMLLELPEEEREKEMKILYSFAQSDNLWRKRVAIISTLAFIREDKFDDTLNMAEMLMRDSHDLIHKAVGWMLREVGKRDSLLLEKFLRQGGNYKKMPRTMLRYAIERFDELTRQRYLAGTV
ncbi:MAG: DNA alkylation repair protein [archaeon]